MVLTCIVFFFWILISAIRDYGYITEKPAIWHSADAANRVMLSTFVSHMVLGDWTFAMVFLSTYWILFDMYLNKLRGKPLLYVGQTSFIDVAFIMASVIFRKKPSIMMLVAKILVLLISVLIYKWSWMVNILFPS